MHSSEIDFNLAISGAFFGDFEMNFKLNCKNIFCTFFFSNRVDKKLQNITKYVRKRNKKNREKS